MDSDDRPANTCFRARISGLLTAVIIESALTFRSGNPLAPRLRHRFDNFGVYSGIMSKSNQFKKPAAEQLKPRKCLMCGEEFSSEGPHNRICRKCKSSQVYREGETRYSV
ncbi:MAG: hypothetical protein QF926_00595 [Alphaproteobacteria bacterium]|nr:hypothetical protein [Alphaproteobacteria bacterium]MDP6515108.1 hypothetical protein [Alphaproteobacteria bacterium]